jgi:hypothetical protein
MSWGMRIDDVMRALEAYWESALPGRQAAEFNSGWRELQRLLDRIGPRERQPLRLVTDR